MSTGTRSAQTSPEGSDLSGRTLGDFQLLRKIGQGGMGQVYLAEQISLKRKVALKLLRAEKDGSADALQRFKLEAQAVAKATHANIVQVYAIDEAEGMPYMALEYVEGRNLKEYISKKGSPDLLVAISIMRQVASALQRASELGIVHRDIKPENILLTRKGEVKVADFGLSRCLQGDQPALHLTQSGVTMGTPLYMSPEQVEGKPVDPRSDIYSFGVTCYYMLAGQPPFRGDSPFEVALAHVRKQPPALARQRPDLPELMCAIVHKMMAKDPDQRYQTGRDLLRDLVRLRESLGGASIAMPLPTMALDQAASPTARTVADEPTTALAGPLRQRNWLLLAAAASVLMVGGLSATIAWKRQSRSAPTAGVAAVQPADAGAMEALLLPNKREQALRQAAEQYLNPAMGKTRDLAGGFGVCADLGLFYLEEDRLTDAETLFARLKTFNEPRSYTLLGRLGLAIVWALRNEANESNKEFRALFTPPAGLVKGGKGKKGEGAFPGMQRMREVTVPLKPVLDNKNWGYWIARARWYNQMNGVREADVPKFLTTRFTFRPGAAEPGKPPADRPGSKK